MTELTKEIKSKSSIPRVISLMATFMMASKKFIRHSQVSNLLESLIELIGEIVILHVQARLFFHCVDEALEKVITSGSCFLNTIFRHSLIEKSCGSVVRRIVWEWLNYLTCGNFPDFLLIEISP
uniref:SAD1 protein n=1 Tax=Fopius arisanus TaxID=64838 RepID=A0A0C9R1Z6_9HYME